MLYDYTYIKHSSTRSVLKKIAPKRGNSTNTWTNGFGSSTVPSRWWRWLAVDWWESSAGIGTGAAVWDEGSLAESSRSPWKWGAVGRAASTVKAAEMRNRGEHICTFVEPPPAPNVTRFSISRSRSVATWFRKTVCERLQAWQIMERSIGSTHLGGGETGSLVALVKLAAQTLDEQLVLGGGAFGGSDVVLELVDARLVVGLARMGRLTLKASIQSATPFIIIAWVSERGEGRLQLYK